MRLRQLAAIAALAGVATAASTPPDKALPATLRGLVESNLKAYNAKDAGGVLATLHTNSPEYERTRDALADQFTEGITARLVDFRYMGHDDEFVVARVKTAVAGPPGSGFQDNVTDSLVLFHLQGGVWKLWSDSVLGVEFGPAQP